MSTLGPVYTQEGLSKGRWTLNFQREGILNSGLVTVLSGQITWERTDVTLEGPCGLG